MQEMSFKRPKFQNGISNQYILYKSALKLQEMPSQRPKFQKIFGGACPRTPLQLCRHYGLPLTKILATPLHEVYEHFLKANQIDPTWTLDRSEIDLNQKRSECERSPNAN